MSLRAVSVVVLALLPALPAPARAAACDPPPGGYRVAVERFVPFENRFGETIAVDLYRPAAGDGTPLTASGCTFAVVLESSPYRDWTSPQPTKVNDDDRRNWWVQRGYIYAFADVPGAGGSDGTWCLLCLHEQLSGADVVEKLGTMPGSNGQVGMIGGSYPGIMSLLVAQHRPPHLAAVIAAEFLVDPYTDFFFPGGMRRGEDALALMAAFTGLSRWTARYGAPSSQADVERTVEVLGGRVSSPTPEFLSIQDAHPLRDEWYEERTIHPERITVPVYLVGGWNDMFARATWSVYERLGSQVKVLQHGPFTHVPVFMPPGAWPCEGPSNDFCGAPLFDFFLKGAGSPAFDKMLERPVRWYVQPAAGYSEGASKPATVPWEMTLGVAGQSEVLRWQPAAGLTSGRWFFRGSVPGAYPPFDYYLGIDGPPDQRIEEQTILSFASPPLDRDVTIVGSGIASLLLSADATDADVVVRLVDEFPAEPPFPAGYAYLVTSGWLRASHRAGHAYADVRALVPAEPTRIDVEIWPTGYRFPKGHRIRIDIAPSDAPRFAPQMSPVNLTIDLGQSRVTLPAVT